MKFNRRALQAFSLVLSLALAAPVALAVDGISYERVNTANLASGMRYDRLVVKFKEGSAQRADESTRLSSLNAAAAKALPGASLRIGQDKRLAVGADVITLSSGLDHVQAATLMQQIAADPSVEYVEPIVVMEHFAVPTDPRWPAQWHLKPPAESAGGINLPAALDHSTGTGVVVAVIDGGVVDHPDLSANVLLDEGYDFISEARNSGRAQDGRAPGGRDPGSWRAAGHCGPGTAARPSSWHGTHVSGTIAAVTNNGVGVAGVAPDAVILPIRALGKCGGDSDDISDAIYWAAGGRAVPGVPAHGLDVEVINMSLGSVSAMVCPNIYKDALAHAHSRGVTVVVAAGNDAIDAAKASGVGHTMANCSDAIIVVGGTGPEGRRSGLINYQGRIIDLAPLGGGGSNHGHRIDVAAPGGDFGSVAGVLTENQVLSTVDMGRQGPEGPQYAFMPGTSMASPHVAGVVALMQAAAPSRLTPAQVRQIVMGTARAFPVAMDQRLGTGIVDAEAAVLAARAGACAATDGACTRAAIRLANKQPYELRAGAAGSETLYKIEVPEGQRGALSVLTSGGTGDANVLVSHGRAPTQAASEHRSVRSGNNEVVRITRPAAGTYYIKLVGHRAYSGVRLEARID